MKLFKQFIFAAAAISAMLLTGCDKEEPEAFGYIYGVVTSNSTSGGAIYNAAVTLMPIGKTTVTGSDGSFQFFDLEPGDYVVQVSASGYRTNTKQIRVKPGLENRMDIPLTQGVTEVTISPATLDFGKTAVTKSFTIYNNGSQPITWSARPDCAWIHSLSSNSGTIVANSSQVIAVTVNRTNLTKTSDMTTIDISTNSDDRLSVSVSIAKSDGGTGGDDPLPPSLTVTNGLYAYYTFENTTNDLTVNEMNAAPINGPKYITAFDGTQGISFLAKDNSYISVPDGMINGEKMSISFWVKGLGNGHIFSASTAKDNNKICAFMMQDGKFQYATSTYSINYPTRRAIFAHPDINGDNWHMITLTSERTDYSTMSNKLYINGQYVAIATEHLTYTDSFNDSINFVFGGKLEEYYTTLNAVTMQLDNLRIYNTRTLSAKEVKAIYDAEKGM